MNSRLTANVLGIALFSTVCFLTSAIVEAGPSMSTLRPVQCEVKSINMDKKAPSYFIGKPVYALNNIGIKTFTKGAVTPKKVNVNQRITTQVRSYSSCFMKDVTNDSIKNELNGYEETKNNGDREKDNTTVLVDGVNEKRNTRRYSEIELRMAAGMQRFEEKVARGEAEPVSAEVLRRMAEQLKDISGY